MPVRSSSSGSVRLYTEFYSPVELSVGESAYIDSEMEHAFVSIGEGDAAIISICLSSQSTQAFFAAAGMHETSGLTGQASTIGIARGVVRRLQGRARSAGADPKEDA